MAEPGTVIPLLIALLGVVPAYRGIQVHRVHVMILGFLITGIAGAWLAANIGSGGFSIILSFFVFGGLGTQIALFAEMIIVALGGFIVANVFTAILFSIDMGHPLALIAGMAGAAFTWKAYIFVIITYTAGFGALLVAGGLTVARDWGPFAMAEAIRFFRMTFFAVFLSGVMVQLAFVSAGYLSISRMSRDNTEDQQEPDMTEEDRLQAVWESAPPPPEVEKFSNQYYWGRDLLTSPEKEILLGLFMFGMIIGLIFEGSLRGVIFVGMLAVLGGLALAPHYFDGKLEAMNSGEPEQETAP